MDSAQVATKDTIGPGNPPSGRSTLGVSRDGASLRVTFAGNLESASTVSGPWTPIAGAASQLVEDANSGQKYYRVRPGIWGERSLRETRQRLDDLALGSTTAQLKIAIIGDSWTHNPYRWTRKFATQLRAQYGHAGPGWNGFSFPIGLSRLVNGNIDPIESGIQLTGNWTPNYYRSISPDLGSISSSTPGDMITITGPSAVSAVRLFFIGTEGASVQYRWNGGSWTELNVTGSGLQIVNLEGVPAKNWYMEIAVVAGTPNLCGVDIQRATPGVVIHKLGATGSRSEFWAKVEESGWEASMAALDPQLVIIMLGTNDQPVYTAEIFRSYMQTILTRIKQAVLSAEILLVAPCENQRGMANPMSTYALETYQLAAENSAAYLDLQPFFGIDPNDYAAGSSRPLFQTDMVHPDPATGGVVIADAVLQALAQR